VTTREARAETSRAGLALVGYLLVVTVVITLAPFRFVRPSSVHLSWIVAPGDMVANVLLFLPLGFLGRLSIGSAWLRVPHAVALGGAALSLAIEALQTFLPGRYPSLVDVLSNGAGAWLGAHLHLSVERGLGRRLVTAMALELPLMNLVYLLAPLLWLDGVAAGRDHTRLWLLPILGLFGGGVLAAIGRERLSAGTRTSVNGIAAAAAAWFTIAAFPAARVAPWFVVACAVALAVVVRVEARPAIAAGADRRFELPTLRRLWPGYAAYVLLAALWPWPWTPVPWRGAVGMVELDDTPSMVAMLRLLEYLASFTLSGYMLAEARGRRDEGRWRVGLTVVAAAIGAAALIEGLRGVHPAHGASVLHLALAAVMALYGALIYRLQLAVVRRLVGGGAGTR
jgi:VanZ family protein